MTQLLNISELSEKIGFSKVTIYKWAKANKIPHVRMPGNDIRFNTQKIEEWIELRTINKKS